MNEMSVISAERMSVQPIIHARKGTERKDKQHHPSYCLVVVLMLLLESVISPKLVYLFSFFSLPFFLHLFLFFLCLISYSANAFASCVGWLVCDTPSFFDS
jgi:hypothetical protein